jgi:cell wall assembly regulator SMI1
MARPSFDWKEFLEEWSAEIMQLLKGYQQYDLIDLEAEAIARNSLAYPGATDEQIKALETRLGVTLPPSYIEFLKTTNGWIQIAMDAGDGKIWSTDEVQWFRDQDPQWIAAWTDYAYKVPDEKYFVYGKEQDCVTLRI